MHELRTEVEALIKKKRVEYNRELTDILNRHNIDNHSDIPDFILAQYLEDCLTAFATATRAKERWDDQDKSPGEGG